MAFKACLIIIYVFISNMKGHLLETFTIAKAMVDDPGFIKRKKKALTSMDLDTIDRPIRKLIKDINQLDYCFTMQSCWGHFLVKRQEEINNLLRLSGPADRKDLVVYRIAYVAFCIKKSPEGKRFIQTIKDITSHEKQYIQFGSAEWFWRRNINSYVLQVSPERYKGKDSIRVRYDQALHIQNTRDLFYDVLSEKIERLL